MTNSWEQTWGNRSGYVTLRNTVSSRDSQFPLLEFPCYVAALADVQYKLYHCNDNWNLAYQQNPSSWTAPILDTWNSSDLGQKIPEVSQGARVPCAPRWLRHCDISQKLHSGSCLEVFFTTIDCFCLSNRPHGLQELFAHRCICFSFISLILVISMCGRLSWPALWSSLGCTIIYWYYNYYYYYCCLGLIQLPLRQIFCTSQSLQFTKTPNTLSDLYPQIFYP